MTADPRAAALFRAVVDLEPAEALVILDLACQGAPALRRTVEELLAHDRAAAPGFLQPNGAQAAAALRALAEATTAAPRTRAGASLPDSAAVGRYRVLHQLAGGGMGEVFAAYDESLDRKVALKVLHAGGVPDDWLRREAQALARLSHPNVVQVHEIGEDRGRPFVAMELVDGITLGAWLDASPRRPAEILRLFLECGRGLAAAHAAGVVHRDFKPSNVVVGHDGRARVLDFGIAATGRGDDDEALTSAGTPLFMSPEQHAAEPATPASDQFSFCVALYRALYGVAPFAGEDLPTLREHVLAGALRKPPASAAPEWVAPLLLRGLARHAAARFERLDELLGGIERRLPHDPELDPSTTSRGRRLFAVAMFALGVVLFAYLHLRGGDRSVTTPRQLVGFSVVVLAAALVGAFALRRKLLANRFGVRVAAVMLTALVSLVVHRLVAMWFDAPIAETVAVDMLMMGFELVVVAVLLHRGFALPAALFFVGTLVGIGAPSLAVSAMALTSLAVFAVSAYFASRLD